MIKIGELVESQRSIAFGIPEQMTFRAAVGRQVTQVLHSRVPGRPRIAIAQAASAGQLLDARVERPAPEAAFKALMKIAHFPEFVFDPARFNFFLKHTQSRGREVVLYQRLESGL